MSPAEARFREVEAILDSKLDEYRKDKASADVLFQDLSARTYHYKNQFLSWSWRIIRDTPLDGETERVSVSIDYGEPRDGKDEVEIAIRAEVFQSGQISRIDRRGERNITVEQFVAAPFVTFIEDCFARGRALRAEKP